MTALTPDEVVERFGANWPRLDEPTKWHIRYTLMLLEDAGLVVVDATDTPGERPPCPKECAGSRTCALNHHNPRCIYDDEAGGSPGERGTVTQETSADDTLRRARELAHAYGKGRPLLLDPRIAALLDLLVDGGTDG